MGSPRDNPDHQRHGIMAGRYELLELAGTGGMATVWRGVKRQGGIETPVAVKRILLRIAKDPTVVALFEEEARVGSQLHHPNIVQVLEHGTDDAGSMFLVMEWVEGLDLFDYMRSFHEAKVHVPWQAVTAVGYQVLLGLVAAHERRDSQGRHCPVIHRDLTPSNILVGVDGVVKVADFGLARASDRATMTFPNIIKGKLSYTAPELIRGKKANEQTDIYSLGVTMWEALAARKLFRANNNAELLMMIQQAALPSLSTYRPDVPPVLATIVHKALQRDPAQRWASAREMATPLLEFARTIQPRVNARRLGASVVQARQRLQSIDAQVPIVIDESQQEDSIEISVDVEVDWSVERPSRVFRAELSDPFQGE